MNGKRIISALLMASLLAAATAVAEPAQWKSREINFNFMGWRTLYTCTGLEEKVRSILLELGARRGSSMKVQASGCVLSSSEPTKVARVSAKFQTLEPASGGAVDAEWKAFRTRTSQLATLNTGDCELLETMKQALTTNFTLRNTEFRTSCVPGEPHVDFRGEALTAPKLTAAK